MIVLFPTARERDAMQGDDHKADRKLEGLRAALAVGERDLAAGRVIILESDEEIRRFFDDLHAAEDEPSPSPAGFEIDP
jgi:hypothetical protein